MQGNEIVLVFAPGRLQHQGAVYSTTARGKYLLVVYYPITIINRLNATEAVSILSIARSRAM